MPAPAAVLAASPLAVLVLAWNEAAPAVRALVEATQASAPVVDSILVMVPQADNAHLSAEEYLPVTLPALPPPAPAQPTPLPQAAASEPAPTVKASEPGSEIAENQLIENKGVTTNLNRLVPAAPAPLTWAEVRVLRLGSLSLPQLAQRAGQPLPAPTWTGLTALPATPYLGAAEPAAGLESTITDYKSADYVDNLATQALPAELPTAAEPAAAAETELPPAEPDYEPVEFAQAPDPEADLLPRVADELAAFELSISSLPDSSEDFLPAASPAQAGWPQALAALRQVAALPPPGLAAAEPAAAPVAGPAAHPALRPAASHYPAPDLNFQIIQYARFAVPVALAEPPFAVIYAPAWPTWLAAQELRQRTGRPLVVHVATLAAGAGESVETATGWMAELQRQALRRADLILAETPTLAQRLRHELGLPFAAVQAVPAADAAAIAQALHGAQPRPALRLAS